MRIGKITAIDATGPKRNVNVRIASDELFSEIADPSGPIQGGDITAVRVAEQAGDTNVLHLYLETSGGKSIRFYTAETKFDITLLLDELEASLGQIPRIWTKAEPAAGGNAG